MDLFQALFNTHAFMPHGCCYLWTEPLIVLHVIGDFMAGLAFIWASGLLVWLVRKREDLAFGWMFLCFSLFITLCGIGHWMEIVTIWHPVYWLTGTLKAMTALASVTAALLLPGVVKKVLTLSTPRALENLHNSLEAANENLTSMTMQLSAAKDKAMETSRLKSQFLENTSFGIRTPLAAVLGMTELLLDTPLDADQLSLASGIHESASSLLIIVNDIIDLSKIEAGKIDLVTTPLDVTNLVHSVADLIAPQAQQKGIALTTAIDPAIASDLMGDPSRLKQVLINLGANAVKFTESGEVVIKAQLEHESAETSRVTFTVTDTGIGIARESISRLFQPFSQVDGSPARRYRGTGLGLSICKSLVNLMGGEIGVESEPSRGSKFWFWVDLVHARKDMVPPSPGMQERQELGLMDISTSWSSSAKGTAGAVIDEPLHCDSPVARRSDMLPGKVILVVEDNEVLRDLTMRRLRYLGLAAHGVSNGKEAMESILQHHYDLVLLDCQMPLLDGYQTVATIREGEEGGTAHLPVIAMTASSRHEDREHCIMAGMDGYLSKPFALGDLRDTLHQFLAQANRGEE